MILTLENKEEAAPGVETFTLNAVDLPVWEPGQYLKYKLPHDNSDARGSVRWFTIAAPPYEERIKITTRVLQEKGSSFKNTLLDLPIGAEIETGSPSGDFLFDTARPAILIAGGIGVTPYRAMLLQLDHDKTDFQATLLYANRDENYLFKSEFEDIAARNDKLRLSYFTDPQHIGLGEIQAAAAPYDNPLYYISGPEPMVESYKLLIVNSGIDETNVRTDYFPGYENV